ncbi:amino acid ABC transporter permease [Pseudomonas sp. PDM26]|uniref:amino acid ABC transporter permease n=1 Tax=Pseudomonas sp. PDM26 TaxID=2854766 RepID=UPI001C45C761|nr:amino acid ABC transporter permease [Pseudomonas sp. PDM26]MBV7547369.1 amino acid ABC transporter permease [Pseudomonas sp. PDM26]
MHNFLSSFITLFQPPYDVLLLEGLVLTLKLTVFSWILAVALGAMLAIVRESKIVFFQKIVASYVAFQRNVPMLVHILLWYFGVSNILPVSVQDHLSALGSEFIYPAIAIGLCMAAYFCEDIRSGLRSIPFGQHEASRSLGMSYLKSMRHVIMPQALRICAPPFINHTVLLFKNTSLAMAVGAAELTYAVRDIENQTFLTFQAYLIATLFYLLVSLSLMWVGSVVAHHTRIPAR